MFIRAFVTVERRDIAEVDVDAIALKHAQAFYGADAAIARRLQEKGVPIAALSPTQGRHVLVESVGAVRARKVLLIGVPPLNVFSYSDIRQLSCDVLRILATAAPETATIAMTIHGLGFGLDEVECVEQQLQGYRDALSAMTFPSHLNDIVIVENDASRADLIEQVLNESIKRDDRFLNVFRERSIREGTGAAYTSHVLMPDPVRPITPNPSEKARIFVAMPFSKEMRDVWTFGIQQPVRDAGLLCERLDEEAFTGDILKQIKGRIENADLIIADLTGANPNVFLEVGYAWGKERPTLLLCRKPPRARDEKKLPFDVSGQKCILYEDATHLHDQLESELTKLKLAVRSQTGHA